MKNRLMFNLYMPNKRHAWFYIKEFEICDSETVYILHMALYSGKDYPQGGNQLFTQTVVMELMSKANILDKYYHLFTDNFHTKLPLVDLLSRQQTLLPVH